MEYYTTHVIALTGAGSGMGRAIALQLARIGCEGLALTDRDQAGLDETKTQCESLGAKVSSYCFDIRDSAKLEEFANDTVAFHGRCSVLINMAGMAVIGSFEEQSKEVFDLQMDVNFRALVDATRIFLPILKREKVAHIVNISSMYGYIATEGNSSYHASKFAVKGYSESLRLESNDDFPNVHISVVHPGYIQTNIVKNAAVVSDEQTKNLANQLFDLVAMTTSEQAAETILTAVAKKQFRVLIGPDAVTMETLVRLFPTSLYTRRYLRIPLLAIGLSNSFLAAKVRDLTGLGDRTSLLVAAALQYALASRLKNRIFLHAGL